MPNLRFNLTVEDDESSLTVYYDGKVYQADNTHPSWDNIYDGVVVDDDPNTLPLFAPADTIRERLSERVSIDAWGKVYFDHDVINDSLTDQIVRLNREGSELTPWVTFLENVRSNPNENSREHLYRHISKHQYTISENGMILAYKAVRRTDDGSYESTTAGPAIVDGEPHTGGYVPNEIGSVIEMARSEVTFDPHNTCSHGLHVAAWEYTQRMYGGNPVLLVEVNPRDVVSVPNDYNDGKVRVCRYKVLREVTEPLSNALEVIETPVEEDRYKDLDDCPYCGDGECYLDDCGEDLSDLREDFLSEDDEDEKEVTDNVSSSTKRYRYPSQADWDHMVDRAKTRKQSLVKYLSKMTNWTPIEDRDNRDRKGWAV